MAGIAEQTAERQRGCRQSCNAASGSWWQRRGSCRHYTAERQRGCRQSCNAASGSWWQQRGSCRHWRPSTTICIAGQFTRSLATTSSAVLSHGTGKFHTRAHNCTLTFTYTVVVPRTYLIGKEHLKEQLDLWDSVGASLGANQTLQSTPTAALQSVECVECEEAFESVHHAHVWWILVSLLKLVTYISRLLL